MYNHQPDTFLTVSEAGSFSRAAEALYISPTAVIKQINIFILCRGFSMRPCSISESAGAWCFPMKLCVCL